jgi:hypothetical protein
LPWQLSQRPALVLDVQLLGVDPWQVFTEQERVTGSYVALASLGSKVIAARLSSCSA